MIQLPNSATVAALGLALGLALGAGAYHVLAGGTSNALSGPTGIVELGRFLQPSDTSSQDEADREIRFRTRTVTDTVRAVDSVFVPIPGELSGKELLVSDDTPLDVGTNQVTWTAWNAREGRHEQRVYDVPSPAWGAGLYALLRLRNPTRLGLSAPTRWGAGVGGKVRYRAVELHARATISPRLRPLVSTSLRWQF